MIRKPKPKVPKIAVIGGGSWATALVKILTDNNNKIRWWMRNQEAIKYVKTYHRNPNYLSYVELNLRKYQVSDNLNRMINNSDILVLAIPAAFFKDVFEKVKPRNLNKKIIISAIKGLIPDDNLIIAEYLKQTYGVLESNLVVLSGPCHAEEVALEKLSYLTIASTKKTIAQKIAELFENRYIKTTISDDIYGTEYAAVLKNIIAIASGICHGLGYGDNFQAVLISNAIQEISRFLDVVHPIGREVNNSAYLGDLLVTAYSQFSRNRTFGNMIGKGYSVTSAQMEMNMIAEGYYAVKSIHSINEQYKVDMPIVDTVYKILYEGELSRMAVQRLTEKLG
ncbi:MAG: NAD(P)H-dependent glycerol-3-phosphate dehydrogenase [Bacteroidetes bacterium]|nr:NAD(P)H-dependent glycerol-3-phosphate dehydrogenase [Bacteroidota bacterium]